MSKVLYDVRISEFLISDPLIDILYQIISYINELFTNPFNKLTCELNISVINPIGTNVRTVSWYGFSNS